MTALVNPAGTVLERYLYDPYGHLTVMDGSWGYVDPRGRMVIGAVFEDAEAFRDGIAKVVVAEKVAYIDKHGRIIVRTEMGGAKF